MKSLYFLWANSTMLDFHSKVFNCCAVATGFVNILHEFDLNFIWEYFSRLLVKRLRCKQMFTRHTQKVKNNFKENRSWTIINIYWLRLGQGNQRFDASKSAIVIGNLCDAAGISFLCALVFKNKAYRNICQSLDFWPLRDRTSFTWFSSARLL